MFATEPIADGRGGNAAKEIGLGDDLVELRRPLKAARII
jgi:hypothetical protein